jgi:hypothetical protein
LNFRARSFLGKLRQLRHVGRNPARLLAGEHLGSRFYRPIPPAFAIIVPERGLSGSKAMEWFKRKTSIAGYEISNWIIVLGAIIIVLLVFQNLQRP